MNIQQLPFANSVTPFSAPGKQAVGEESTEAKAAPLPPVEELAETAGSLNRKDPSDTTTQTEERQRVASGVSVEGSESTENIEQPSGVEQQNTNGEAIQFTEDELRQIQALATRDREVRAHEQAHVSVGGQFAGAASYSFKEGPDGVRYAVGGEVSISAGGVPGDPQATINRAQQIQRAALAPADPSAQDRSVAANAVRLALDARAELSMLQTEERSVEREETQQSLDAQKEAGESRREQVRAGESEEENSASQDEQRQQNFDINQRLLDIGVSEKGQDIGSLLDSIV